METTIFQYANEFMQYRGCRVTGGAGYRVHGAWCMQCRIPAWNAGLAGFKGEWCRRLIAHVQGSEHARYRGSEVQGVECKSAHDAGYRECKLQHVLECMVEDVREF